MHPATCLRRRHLPASLPSFWCVRSMWGSTRDPCSKALFMFSCDLPQHALALMRTHWCSSLRHDSCRCVRAGRGGLSAGAIVGVVLGAIAAVGLLAAVLAGLLLRRRTRRKRAAQHGFLLHPDVRPALCTTACNLRRTGLALQCDVSVLSIMTRKLCELQRAANGLVCVWEEKAKGFAMQERKMWPCVGRSRARWAV